MLSSIADKIWGTQCLAEDTISPGQSTVASTDDDNGPDGSAVCWEDPCCSVWEVDGTEATEVLSKTCVRFDDEKLVLVGVVEDVGEEGGKKDNTREVMYEDIGHFQEHEAGICQWVVRRSSDSLDECGLVFFSPPHAAAFSCAIRPRIRASAELLCREPICLRLYDTSTKTWEDIQTEATISILQRKKDSEGFLVVTDIGCDEVFSEIGISNEEYIFPQESEQQLNWWGPAPSSLLINDNNGGGGGGEEGTGGGGAEVQLGMRKMYAGRFVEKDGMMKAFEILNRVLRDSSQEQGQNDGGGAEYEYDEFDMNTVEDEVKWLDAEEDEILPEAVVCRDSTRRIVAKEPGSRIHKMMFVGSSRTFVVRGTAGANQQPGNTEMQVLKFTEDGKDEIVATLDSDKLKYGSQHVCPNKALLHDQESKLLLLDENHSSNVFVMDVENQKVMYIYI
eukprot:GHVQ01042632.1.p1 GENE.GHVQ01042632.1~~GHVQ01042632.1.p1  ORF type:complete len:449 (+),score=98.95 GHVQ01042632.1:877-2223(+)